MSEESPKNGWSLETRAAIGAALVVAAFGAMQAGMPAWHVLGILGAMETSLFVRYIRFVEISSTQEKMKRKAAAKRKG